MKIQQKWIAIIKDGEHSYGPLRVKGQDVKQAAYRAVRLVVARRGKDLSLQASIVINPDAPKSKIILVK